MTADLFADFGDEISFADCTHPERIMVRLDCGAGGIQYRRYCLSCWRSLGGAIPHARAKAELHGEEAPLADLDQLHRARDCYLRKLYA